MRQPSRTDAASSCSSAFSTGTAAALASPRSSPQRPVIPDHTSFARCPRPARGSLASVALSSEQAKQFYSFSGVEFTTIFHLDFWLDAMIPVSFRFLPDATRTVLHVYRLDELIRAQPDLIDMLLPVRHFAFDPARLTQARGLPVRDRSHSDVELPQQVDCRIGPRERPKTGGRRITASRLKIMNNPGENLIHPHKRQAGSVGQEQRDARRDEPWFHLQC